MSAVNHYQSILPEFDIFESPGPVRAPPGGQMLGRVSPRRAAAFLVSPAAAAMRGLGVETPTAPEPVMPPPGPAAPPAYATAKPMPVLVALGLLGVFGYLSYEIGSAVAPTGSNKRTWGLIGIPVGLVSGPIGLGIMAIVSNHGKGRH